MLSVYLKEMTPGKFIVRIGEWEIGPYKLRILNRRAVAYLKELDGQEKGIAEKRRYDKAPKKSCPRCKGKGYLETYLHVAHGVCFKCGGDGTVEKKIRN